MSIEIRLAQSSDLPSASRVMQAAFQRTHSFEPVLRVQQRAQPDGLWLAFDGSDIVGSVGCIHYGPLAYIGLMAVHPDYQRRGLGRRMMDSLLAWLDARRCPTALLDATEAGSHLYFPLDFVDVASARLFDCEPEARRPAASGHFRISQPAIGDFESLARFDATHFGADRERLLRGLWRDKRDRWLVARDSSGQLAGHLLVGDPVLGPWVAESPAAAKALLLAAIELPMQNGRPTVLVPGGNAVCGDLLC